MDAIDKATRKFGSVEGLDLYVARYRKDGTPAISKPCVHCMKHIKAANLRRVYYVNEEGEWAHLVVSREV